MRSNRVRVIKVPIRRHPWVVFCGFCCPASYPPPHRVADDWWAAQNYASKHAANISALVHYESLGGAA